MSIHVRQIISLFFLIPLSKIKLFSNASLIQDAVPSGIIQIMSSFLSANEYISLVTISDVSPMDLLKRLIDSKVGIFT